MEDKVVTLAAKYCDSRNPISSLSSMAKKKKMCHVQLLDSQRMTSQVFTDGHFQTRDLFTLPSTTIFTS